MKKVPTRIQYQIFAWPTYVFSSFCLTVFYKLDEIYGAYGDIGFSAIGLFGLVLWIFYSHSNRDTIIYWLIMSASLSALFGLNGFWYEAYFISVALFLASIVVALIKPKPKK